MPTNLLCVNKGCCVQQPNRIGAALCVPQVCSQHKCVSPSSCANQGPGLGSLQPSMCDAPYPSFCDGMIHVTRIRSCLSCDVFPGRHPVSQHVRTPFLPRNHPLCSGKNRVRCKQFFTRPRHGPPNLLVSARGWKAGHAQTGMHDFCRLHCTNAKMSTP